MGKAEKYRYLAVFLDAWTNEAAMTDEARRKGDELTLEDLQEMREIAEERAQMMNELRLAVEENNTLKIIETARRLCGLETETKQ